MNNLNLLLSFKLADDPALQVRGAARIEVDARGGLVVYDSQTGAPERFPISQMKSFLIHNPSRNGLLPRSA